jgi:regulatory protein
VAAITSTLKNRALASLARREHSRAELERKLARHVEDLPDITAKQQVARALDELSACGLLNDQRVAESLVASRSGRFGARRLQQDLELKGVAQALIVSALNTVQASEFERARALWLRRFGVPAVAPKERARQMRFLAGRGFRSDVIRLVVRGSADRQCEQAAQETALADDAVGLMADQDD